MKTELRQDEVVILKEHTLNVILYDQNATVMNINVRDNFTYELNFEVKKSMNDEKTAILLKPFFYGGYVEFFDEITGASVEVYRLSKSDLELLNE